MISKILSATVIFIFFFLALSAQDLKKDYVPLSNSGKLSKEFFTSSTAKYQMQKATIERKQKRSKRKAQQEFYLNSNFVIDELLHSGKVLFSDDVTKYVNRVADELLKNNKKLRSKLNIYTVKSAVPNAFATDRGGVYINIGLIASVDSEAELAFVLSHEITHFEKKHNINTHVSFDQIDANSKKMSYRKRKNYDALLKKSNYSKKMETEADEIGLQRFLKSDYSPTSAIKIFDHLEYAHISYENMKLERSFLNLPGLTLPEKLFLTNVEKAKPLEDDDEYSTHPNVDERRRNVMGELLDKKFPGKKDFILPEEDFHAMQELARFELCDILLQNESYPAALYHAKLLQKKYPDNKFLKTTIGYAIYGMAQYKNLDRFDEAVLDYKDLQGEMQQVYHVFDKMSKEELNLVASRYAWDLHHQYPSDEQLDLILHDQVEDMVIYQIEKPTKFFSDKQMKLDTSSRQFARLAFRSIAKDTLFVKMLKDGKHYRQKKEEEESNSKKKKKKEQLGLKSSIVLNPSYYRFDLKNQFKLKYVYSEKRQAEYIEIIDKSADAAGLKITTLDTKELRSDSKRNTSLFNDSALLTDWTNEMLEHNMYMVNHNHNRVQQLVKEYGADNVVLFGNFALKIKTRSQHIAVGTLMLLTPPFSPFALTQYLPKRLSLTYAIVLDLKNDRVLLEDFNRFSQNDNKNVLGMSMYSTMQQMTAKPLK